MAVDLVHYREQAGGVDLSKVGRQHNAAVEKHSTMAQLTFNAKTI